ncbi:MAG: hypothetical protein A2168_08920 [Planctomycetes bacterium RBG_13_50_24]|nr:MAG: hypothetical protein A2168_08920 [Planctomycetes bacterium RBG_13_50_24]
MNEVDLYEPVRAWLERVLKARFKRMNVRTYDSHKTNLSRLIQDLGLQSLFPQFNAWDVKVDVTGIVSNAKIGYIALVECKIKQLTLRDLGQLLGYSKVVNPILSVLTSPSSPSDPLITLLKDYGRLDVLEYGPESRHIRIARWDDVRTEVIPGSVLPRGRLL